jgi:ribonuclease HII
MPKKQEKLLEKYYDNNSELIEIGIDEAGRGPMLGRVYAAAVILPKDDSFQHNLMKDSKRFTSEKKIKEVADYIKKNAIAWSIGYSDEKEIDQINIRNATYNSMHRALKNILDDKQYLILVDGNDFKPYTKCNDELGLIQIPHICITQGDNKYTCIAAASILAKVARDEYIEKLCSDNPELDIRYNILKNKGYGTKIHLDGINTYGITKYHRKTFGICQNYNVDKIES